MTQTQTQTQTLRSAINRCDSNVFAAQLAIEAAIKDIESALDRLTNSTADLRAARMKMLELQKQADTHGLEHEVPYNGM